MAYKIPPQPIGVLPGSGLWNDWIEKVRTAFNNGTGSVTWSNIDFTGGNITSIPNRAHNDLQAFQGGSAGSYFHLTGTQHTDLTDAGDSALHFHSTDRARANHTGTQDHNTTLSGFQGGSASERYHTTAAQNTIIATLDSGTYTPTLANTVNVAASTSYVAQYMRVGSVVTVSGRVDIDPTAASVDTILDISLPIASNFTALEQCAGAASAPQIASYSAAIVAESTNNRARLQFVNGATVTNALWFYTYTYRII